MSLDAKKKENNASSVANVAWSNISSLVTTLAQFCLCAHMFLEFRKSLDIKGQVSHPIDSNGSSLLLAFGWWCPPKFIVRKMSILVCFNYIFTVLLPHSDEVAFDYDYVPEEVMKFTTITSRLFLAGGMRNSVVIYLVVGTAKIWGFPQNERNYALTLDYFA